MATTAKNRITRSVAPKSLFESALSMIDSSVSFNQGDLLYLDTTNHLMKPIASDTNGLTCLGIARQTIVNGKLLSPYSGVATDAAQAIEDISGAQFGVIASMKLKSGDIFLAGQQVYACSVDAQTVSASGSNPIGIMQDAGLTAGASSTGNILLGAKSGSALLY
jgi:hypothetical protein